MVTALTGPNAANCSQLIQKLSSLFPVKVLSPLHYFLGLEIKRTADGHFQAVKKILRFLKGIATHVLWITKDSLHLNAYYDADWLEPF